MKQKPYTNSTNNYLTIGSTLIAPGQTRMVDERLIPGFCRSSDRNEPVPEKTRLQQIAEQNVPEVVEELPNLSLEELDQLAAMDGRVGVQKGIANEKLERAKAVQDSGKNDSSDASSNGDNSDDKNQGDSVTEPAEPNNGSAEPNA